MFVKVLLFSSPNVAYSRAAYFLSAKAKSHERLDKMNRHFVGVPGAISLRNRALGLKASNKAHRGRRIKHVFVEVIISTPVGADLSDAEAVKLWMQVVDYSGSTAAMVGEHWGRDGRLDVHILLLNWTTHNSAIETKLINPLTLREHHNCEVVFRNLTDIVHLEINRAREKAGRPKIPTMEDIQRRDVIDAEERLDDMAAKSIEEFKDIENDADSQEDVSQDLIAEGSTVKSAETVAEFSVTEKGPADDAAALIMSSMRVATGAEKASKTIPVAHDITASALGANATDGASGMLAPLTKNVAASADDARLVDKNARLAEIVAAGRILQSALRSVFQIYGGSVFRQSDEQWWTWDNGAIKKQKNVEAAIRLLKTEEEAKELERALRKISEKRIKHYSQEDEPKKNDQTMGKT